MKLSEHYQVNQTAMSKLTSIKILHTVIWLFFNVVLFYIAYAVITNKIGKWVWAGVGIIIVEGLVLLIFKGICPLTIVARRHSDSSKDNFDIFLPNWLAKYNKLIYTTIFFIIICLLIYRTITR
jgi:hypothetical protein